MSAENLERSTSRIQSHSSSGNNQSRIQDSHRDATLFRHLNDSEKTALLEENGYLHGFLVDGQDEPRQSMRPVARQRQNLPHPINFQEKNNMLTELISSNNNRDANFARYGWSLAARSTTTPWIASRIAKGRNAPDKPWITKRVIVQRLAISIALRDIELVPEFEEEVRAALGRQGKFEKFQALEEVFQYWGDVIPLTFDLGTSLSISDLKKNNQQASRIIVLSFGKAKLTPQKSLNLDVPITLNELTALETARINTQGGDANLLPSGNAAAWLSGTTQPQQWSQVRVAQVIPITELLEQNTKDQLADAYSTLITLLPPALPHSGLQEFSDGSLRSLERISSLYIHFGGSVVSAIVPFYADGTLSSQLGSQGFARPTFRLNNGEHITMVVVWSNSTIIYAIQLITSNGRISAHYGGTDGTPTIMSSEDGVLAGFSGSMSRGHLSQIQTIWRHNIMKSRPNQLNKLSQYVGVVDYRGTPFNDWAFFNRSSRDAHILSIKINSDLSSIYGIQITYGNRATGESASTPAPLHGGNGGNEQELQLAAEEHIIMAEGAYNKQSVRMLRFTTSTGRVSNTYGGHSPGDTEFRCMPPQARDGSSMRLGYIIGKSEKLLLGLSFAWVPLSSRSQ